MLRYVIPTLALVNLVEVSIAAPQAVQTYPNPHSQTANQLNQDQNFQNQPINYGDGAQSQQNPGSTGEGQYGVMEPQAPTDEGQAINPNREIPQN